MIFMSFLPHVVGCLLKTWFTTEGGGGSRAPKDPPGYAPAHTNALRKRAFSKTLFKPEKVENAGFAF